MSRPDLTAEMAQAAKGLRAVHLQALEPLGVSWDTMVSCAWSASYGFGVASVEDIGGGFYQPGEGHSRLIIPVYDDGILVDLCSFRSADPGGWLLRSGYGWALGLERGLERHTWWPARLFATPLEWLQHGADGLCVLDWDAPEVAYLRDVPQLECSTGKLASCLRSALTKPPRLPQISIMEMRLAA